MASSVAEPRPAAAGRPVRGPLRALLKRQIVAGRSAPVPRDPQLIRRRLPAIAWYTGYFTPEVRGLERVPTDGPALLVGNHSCLFYMPEVWTAAQAVMSRRGVDAPTYALAYDLLFAVPGVAATLRRLGAIPADVVEAEAALAAGACVLVYPGGDLEACRPYAQRGRIEFAGRTGFVRLALRSGAPVIPVVAHGGHHAVVVLARGDRLARAVGLSGLRINVFPLLAALPFGVTSILVPPPPMPAHLTLEFLPPLDWSAYGPSAAEDPDAISACFDEITGRMQKALDRLSAEHPHPVALGCAQLALRVAAGATRGARNLGARLQQHGTEGTDR